MENKKPTIEELIGNIMSHNVNLSEEEYNNILMETAKTYDENNKEQTSEVSLEEKRKRIELNYYGSSINLQLQLVNMLNDYFRNYVPLIEAIAEKVGVEFEKIETEEDKAMKAAAEYLRTGTAKRKAELDLINKQNLNREQRRKIKKETGEEIDFKGE